MFECETYVLRHSIAARQRSDAGHEVGRDEGAQHNGALAGGRAHRRVAVEVDGDKHHWHLRDTRRVPALD